jgi:hypothetical protein
VAGSAEHATDWQDVRFTNASDADCDAEQPDADVLRMAGQHQANRAQREALRVSKTDDVPSAHGAAYGRERDRRARRR